MTWALDLDGVVWLGDKVIPGVGESITRLREEGEALGYTGEVLEKYIWMKFHQLPEGEQ